MQSLKQIYRDRHGNRSVVWLEIPPDKTLTFIVTCIAHPERQIAETSLELSKEFAAHLKGMLIKTRGIATVVAVDSRQRGP
jgi:hypothetical protein